MTSAEYRVSHNPAKTLQLESGRHAGKETTSELLKKPPHSVLASKSTVSNRDSVCRSCNEKQVFNVHYLGQNAKDR